MMSNPLDPKDEATRRLIKEAIREWLDEMFTALGKWTIGGLLAEDMYVEAIASGQITDYRKA